MVICCVWGVFFLNKTLKPRKQITVLQQVKFNQIKHTFSASAKKSARQDTFRSLEILMVLLDVIANTALNPDLNLPSWRSLTPSKAEMDGYSVFESHSNHFSQ
jgi:hypothetical protein